MHYPHSPHRSDYFTCYRSGDWKVIYHYFPSEASENSYYQLYNLATTPSSRPTLPPEARSAPPDDQGLIDSMEASTRSIRSTRKTAKPAETDLP